MAADVTLTPWQAGKPIYGRFAPSSVRPLDLSPHDWQ